MGKTQSPTPWVDEVHMTEESIAMIHRMFERGVAYTCNGSPRGCERERMGGCIYHEMKEAADKRANEHLDVTIDRWREEANR